MMFTRILIGAVLATLAMSGAAGAQQLMFRISAISPTDRAVVDPVSCRLGA